MTTESKWFAMSRKTDAEGVKSSEAEVSIYDNIGGFGISANEFIDELKGLGEDVETINVRIASGGGSIVEGNTIFNALKRHGAKVVTHIDSLAASMASVIAMAGDEVRMAENALLMIHNPWTMSMGGAEQLRKDADLLDKMEENIRNSYARSNLSAEELDAAMEEETYYTASEALEAGFIDAIDGANLAAASIGDMETVAEFQKLPQAKLDAIKMECQARQICDMQDKIDLLVGELEVMNEQILIATKALAEATEQHAEALAAMAEEHDKALTEAKEIKDGEVEAKAAAQLAEIGHDPIESAPHEGGDADKQPKGMTEDEFWAEYRKQPTDDRNDWYAENKHLIIS
jgi:ATP-dependent protease ClpP protease subunit